MSGGAATTNRWHHRAGAYCPSGGQNGRINHVFCGDICEIYLASQGTLKVSQSVTQSLSKSALVY